tara:strand:+ start:220 stop:612 length:393 start_codon:yes stop_codon:yes gene_type:complete
MKLTTSKLKELIKEAISEMRTGTQFTGQLSVTTEELPTQSFAGREQNPAERKMGYWKIEGVFNGKEIFIDSKELHRGRPADIEQWEDPRKVKFAMARVLLGHFGKNDPQFVIRAHDLDGVAITVNGGGPV